MALDGYLDRLKLLLLLRHHSQADVTLWRCSPTVRTRRVPHLGFLLPLVKRLTESCGKSLTPFGQQHQEQCAPVL
jgi:hypothetical protein